MTNEPSLTMCWYDEAQWNILKKLDPDAPDDIYEACRGNASRVLQEMNRAGHNVKKVSVKIDMFLRWRAERKAQRRITVGSRGLETPAPRQLIGV